MYRADFSHVRPLGAVGAISSRHMYMFSQHRKLDFFKIISLISGLKCLQKLRLFTENKKIEENYDNLEMYSRIFLL